MKTIEYRFKDIFDKSAWPRGPWDDEPDKKQWQDQTTGYPCLIVRSQTSGGLCGYVGVPKGHPYHGLWYDDCDVDVHGGLTFAGDCAKDLEAKEKGVCHLPDEGESDDVWWLGFDAAHVWDLSPRYHADLGILASEEMVYRDLAYIEQETANLARQLASKI